MKQISAHQLLALTSAIEALLIAVTNSAETRTANTATTVISNLRTADIAVSHDEGAWYVGVDDPGTMAENGDVPLEGALLFSEYGEA